MDKVNFSLNISKAGLKALSQLIEASITSLLEQQVLIFEEMEKPDLQPEQLLRLNNYVLEHINPQLAIGSEILRAIEEAGSSRIILA